MNKSKKQNVAKADLERIPRLAHKILTKMIWPANLNLEEAVDVAITLVKALVLSNSQEETEEDLDDRGDMISWVEDRFSTAMDDFNPDMRPRAWLVTPQGLITEPTVFLWRPGGDVEVVLGLDLAETRADFIEKMGSNGILTEGVEGLAMTDPEWDGESTVTCDNPECGRAHDVHLMCAENMFQDVKEQQSAAQTAPN